MFKPVFLAVLCIASDRARDPNISQRCLDPKLFNHDNGIHVEFPGVGSIHNMKFVVTEKLMFESILSAHQFSVFLNKGRHGPTSNIDFESP